MTPSSFTTEFILEEVRKLQYLYGLKREIRYGQTRSQDDVTESVAEHIYGMHLLAHYFLPLENPEGDWDALRIFSMITIHDLDEVETGDTIAYLKSTELHAAEKLAREKVITESPKHFQENLRSLSDEYEARMTIEAKFVKAIDAFEPLIQIYSPFGRKILKINSTKASQSEISKEKPIKQFPLMYTFYRTIHESMIAEGFFHPDN
jgi:5'-deoxynucleotidase YfbR-like HD superfamily hydrolase